ncbi:MAG: response regulator [Caulobacteraceae bacterium]|nr:response regulator [Caulobacteraceae bacterium]
MKVLYVDDEPDIREVATISLELDPAIKVRAAESGPQALEWVASGDCRPDVVLLDVMMPGMDGPSVLKALRLLEPTRETPVVFITARAQSHERHRFLDLGAAGVITKPFDPMTLATELRAVMAAGPVA